MSCGMSNEMVEEIKQLAKRDVNNYKTPKRRIL